MIDLSIFELDKFYGENQVLDHLSFDIQEGEHVGLLGRNGAGKTTLFKILCGELDYEHGSVVIPKFKRVGVVAQIPEYPQGYTADRVLRSAFEELETVRSRMTHLEKDLTSVAALEEYGQLTERFELLGGYDVNVRLGKVCNGLGISDEMRQSLFQTLSGGERTRINLARMILQNTDILLLDEPTNHLDINAVCWLEDFLSKYKGTVVAISHDRYFLDHVISRVIEIEDGRAEFYSGNYSFYVREKQARLDELCRQYLQQQKKVSQLQHAADKLHIWAQGHDNPDLHRRAFAIERRIARLEVLERPKTEKVLTASFTTKQAQSQDVLTIRSLCKSFGDRELLKDVELLVKEGERVAIVGENGCGKTTLLNLILHTLPADKGSCSFGLSTKTAYLPQLIEFENPEYTVLETVTSALKLTQQAGRNRLAAFDFVGDEVFQKVSSLSGGEKSRLMLCIIMYKELNLLILDEPTNHLDIQSREWIENALESYEGNLLFVSHDRYFINKFATRIWDLKDGQITDFPGTFEKYLAVTAMQAVAEDAKNAQAARTEKSEKKVPSRKSPYTLEKQIAAAERDISRSEEALAQLDRELEASASDFTRLQELLSQREQEQAKLDKLYACWEELAAQAQ